MNEICALNRPAGWLLMGILGLLTLPAANYAQLPSPTYGWNLGNTLEPPGGEGTWGPAATRELINAVADSGFNTVRLPVAWNSHADPRTHRIDAAWMARVRQVVDWCYARNLCVVLNNHWDTGWLDNSGFKQVDPEIDGKVRSYWTQIANAFQGYDQRLLFACSNEPAVETAAQMSVLLAYQQTFVDAVRATGGNNASRWLVVQGPGTDIDRTAQLMNVLPSDPTPGRLMVEVHFYSPYQLCLMSVDENWGKRFYFWGKGYHHATRTEHNATSGEEDFVAAEFRKLSTKFVDRGVPVLLGEFGAIRRLNYPDLTGADLKLHLAGRTHFHKTVVDAANRLGLKPCYWDAGGPGQNGMWLFARTTGAPIDPDNARALTGGDALPPP